MEWEWGLPAYTQRRKINELSQRGGEWRVRRVVKEGRSCLKDTSSH